MVFDENMVNEYASVPASESAVNLWSNLRQITNDENEQPSSPSESDQSNPAKPANPVPRDEGEEGEALTSSSTEEMVDDKSSTTSSAVVANLTSLRDESSEDNTPESSSNSPEREDSGEKKSVEGVQQFPLSRKRSNSMRDSTDSSEGGGHLGAESEDDVRGTVLQEADSTTLGEDNGRDEVMEGGAEAEEGDMEKMAAERDILLEQSPAKKMRSKSPEIETRSSNLERDNMDSLNTVDVKDTVTREIKEVESEDGMESESGTSSMMKIQPHSIEEKDGGRESEEASAVELHSSSGQPERETSTGQLEKSHDPKTDCKYAIYSQILKLLFKYSFN